MSDTLRSRLIRLAHENPDIQGAVLPLVTTTKVAFSDADVQTDIDVHSIKVTEPGSGAYSLRGSFRSTLTVGGNKFELADKFENVFALSVDSKWGLHSSTAAPTSFKTGLVLNGLAGQDTLKLLRLMGDVGFTFEARKGGGQGSQIGLLLDTPPTDQQLVVAAKKLVAELSRVDIKSVLQEALSLPGPRSVEGPKSPSVRDVRLMDYSVSGDRRWIYVRYKIYNADWSRQYKLLEGKEFLEAYKRAGGRY